MNIWTTFEILTRKSVKNGATILKTLTFRSINDQSALLYRLSPYILSSRQTSLVRVYTVEIKINIAVRLLSVVDAIN